MLYVLVGYALAVVLHALWNSSATLGGGEAFLGVYLFFMVPLFLAMIGLAAWQRRREQRTVADQLPAFAMAGWIAPSEVALLSTLAGRNRWRRAVRQRSGKDAEKAVTEYQTAVTELAFLRARMGRGAVGPQAWEWHERAAVRPGRRAGAGDGAAGGAHRGLAASAALGLGAAAPATARLAPEPVAATRLERRPARGGAWNPPPGGGNWGPPRG